MAILVYALAFAVSFLLGVAAAWIPITIMHACNRGNENGFWIPDPGNERRFFAVHNWGQGIGSFASALIGLLSVLWVFSWFHQQSYIWFLILVGISKIFTGHCAAAHYMPRAQATGAALGVALFFIYYVKSY